MKRKHSDETSRSEHAEQTQEMFHIHNLNSYLQNVEKE